jgi:aminopeptidase
MYTPPISDFPTFCLDRLIKTCFGSPSTDLNYCVLIDLDDASELVGLEFLNKDCYPVQKTAYDVFYKQLISSSMSTLRVKNCDFLAFNKTGGSNLDPEDEIYDVEGNILSFAKDIPKYDIVLAITDFSLTAPLTALAKKHNFRGATLHGVNEIILNSGLSIDYNFVSKQAESFRKVLDLADGFTLNFECLGKTFTLNIECNQQVAQKSHGLCPEGKPDVANLPAGEVYFVPTGADGSFPFRFSDGTLAEMHIKDGAIFRSDLLRGDEALVSARNQQLQDDPATGVIGELGFGTQLLPFSGKDIQDEKIFGTCHVATGRSDHLGGNLVPELFASKQNASHDDILFAPPKTPEINVVSVVLHKNSCSHILFESFEPTNFLADLLGEHYPVASLLS